LIGLFLCKKTTRAREGKPLRWKFAASVAQIVIASEFSRQEIVCDFFDARTCASIFTSAGKLDRSIA
jgi:hypothetical protein